MFLLDTSKTEFKKLWLYWKNYESKFLSKLRVEGIQWQKLFPGEHLFQGTDEDKLGITSNFIKNWLNLYYDKSGAKS